MIWWTNIYEIRTSQGENITDLALYFTVVAACYGRHICVP